MFVHVVENATPACKVMADQDEKQSTSVDWLHVNGQHMLAPPPHVVMAGLTTQWALQALPVRVSLRQVLSPPPRGTHWPFTQSSWIGQSLKSKQLDGQVTGQAPGIPGGMPVSQRSEPSTTPLP